MKNIKEAKVLNWDEPLSKALTLLMDEGTAVFVVKDGEYAGLIDDRNVNINLSDPSKTKCINCIERSPVLNQESTIPEMIDSFLSGKFKSLPVINPQTKKIEGAITRIELLEKLSKQNIFSSEQVSILTQSPVYSVDISSTLGEAKRMMRDKNVHKILILDKGRARGILSTYDLSALVLSPKKRDRALMISEIKKPDEKSVSEVLREKIISADYSILLSDAINKMIEKEVSNLLITKNNRPFGVLSSTDVFKKAKEYSKKSFDISVSGLNSEYDKKFYPEIIKKLELVLLKFSKNFSFGNMSLHIKKGKSVYEAKMKINANGKLNSFSCSEHNISELIDSLAIELKKVLLKTKSINTMKKKSRK
ncbi:MAG: CBS domain-containing protein [Candidatus Micrarchaeia archaeon]